MKSTDRVFLYTILIKGHVSGLMLHNQRNFTLKKLSSGNTRIEVMAEDDAAFYGVITVLRDSEVSIIRIERKPIPSRIKKPQNNYKRTPKNSQ